MKLTYSYNIAADNDEEAFINACNLIKKAFAELGEGRLLTDVDGTQVFILESGDDKITVSNDYEVGAVFADSTINLDSILNKWARD